MSIIELNDADWSIAWMNGVDPSFESVTRPESKQATIFLVGVASDSGLEPG